MNRLVVAFVTVAALLAPPAGAADKIRIGLSFADVDERWSRERDEMVKQLTGQGFEVLVQVANYNKLLQNEQLRDLARQGARVILVVPEDGDAAVEAVNEVSAGGVKVIAYDRLVKTPSLAAYVSFDNVEAGRSQARGILAARGSGDFVLLGGSPTDNNARLLRAGQMEVLAPLVKAGKVRIVADQWVNYWDAGVAKQLMDSIIAAGRFDAVVASNDGTALGALQAMKAAGLAGKVPISGQDASAPGCNAVARGELTLTILKDTRRLTPMAVDVAARLARGDRSVELRSVKLADLTGNPTLAGTVPCSFLPVQQVTRENLKKLVVDSGFQPYDAVYAGVQGAPPRSP